jgi:hypothetical protein
VHPLFQQVKKAWWWIESPKALERFSADPFAQGYELLRRIERFGQCLPASHCQPDQTWKQLYRQQRDFFSINYLSTLKRLGLVKHIMAGPGGISFDASQSADYLLKALKFETERPTPVACGASFRVVAKWAPGKEDTTHALRPTSVAPLWEAGIAGAYLPLPPYKCYGEDREFTGPEAYAYFRNFIKDNPPADFVAYRNSLHRKGKALRREAPRHLALGLIAHDYASLQGSELKELAQWICRARSEKTIFGIDGPKLTKAIYHARAHVYGLIQRAATL